MVFGTDANTPIRLTIYTTPTCPDCHALKAWTDCEGIPCDEHDLIVAWPGDEEEQPHHPIRKVAARVTEMRDVTHDIRAIQLALAGDPVAFFAGQYIRFAVPSSPSRDYSMAILPGDTELELYVPHVPGGATPGHNHRNLKQGDAVRIEDLFARQRSQT